MPFNITQAANALKTQYLDAVTHQINFMSDPFATKLEKNGDEIVGGEKAEFLVTSGVMGGIGNRADDGNLPVSSNRNARKVSVVTKNIFATFNLTSKVIKASQGKAGSFIQQLGYMMESLTEDAKVNFARQLHGSTVGAITKVITTAPAGVKSITVENGTNLIPGMRVDFITHPAGTVKASNILIESVDGNTIVVDTNVTCAINDIIVNQGSYLLELTGLEDIMTLDNTIYGIDRSVSKYFNSIRIDGSAAPYSAALSDGLLQAGFDAIELRSGGKPDMLMAAYDVRRLYMDYYEATKRTVNSMTIEGGWKAINFNETPLVVSRYKANGTIDLLDTKTFKLHQLADWDWMDEDGAVLKHDGKMGYYAVLEKFCELACNKPGANVRITGITT